MSYKDTLLSEIKKFESDKEKIDYINNLANSFGNTNDDKKIVCYEILADTFDHFGAKLNLYLLYYSNCIYDKSFALIKQLYEEAHKQNIIHMDTEVPYFLAMSYAKGYGCEKNTELAVKYFNETIASCNKWFEFDPNDGNHMFITNVRNKALSLTQIGIIAFEKKDYKTASDLFYEAVEITHNLLGFNLPLASIYIFYFVIYGIEENKDKRYIDHLKDMANASVEDHAWLQLNGCDTQALANYWLGEIYSDGKTIPKNIFEAKKYYKTALSLGYEPAKEKIAALEQMPEQLGGFLRRKFHQKK